MAAAKKPPCPRPHSETVADPKLWEQCEFVGIQPVDEDESLELRNCVCGSTMSRPVKKNPPPRDMRYWPEAAVDPEDLETPNGMTFLNAVRSVVEVLDADPDRDNLTITYGRGEPLLQNILVRRHRNWPGRYVIEINVPDDVPDTAWTLAHRRPSAWMRNITAVVLGHRVAPGELTEGETRARIAARVAALGGDPEVDRGWAVFDTDRGFEVQIDDEFWSGTRDHERVADDDIMRLPEAQRELRNTRAAAHDRPPLDDRILNALGIDPLQPGATAFAEAIIQRFHRELGPGLELREEIQAAEYLDAMDDEQLDEVARDNLPANTTRVLGDPVRSGARPLLGYQWQGHSLSIGRVEPLAQRIARGEDMADVIDQQVELRRQARAAVATALGIDIDTRIREPFLDGIVDWLNFTVSFRDPSVGEIVWEVNDGDDLDDARDEIWRESEELGWEAGTQVIGSPGYVLSPSRDMKYAVILPDDPSAPGAGNLAYVVNKFINDPEKFREFAEATARRVADEARDVVSRAGLGARQTIYTYHGREYVSQPEAERPRVHGIDDVQTEGREFIRQMMRIRQFSRLNSEQREHALAMIDAVASEIAWNTDNTPDWELILRRAREATGREFERYVYEQTGAAGLIAVDAQGQPYSLQRHPAAWTYRNEPLRVTVPIDYVRPVELEELEVAIANALGLDMNTVPSEQRDFIAAVWEEVLRQRASGAIRFVYSRAMPDEVARFNEQILTAARAIAREETRAFDFGEEGATSRSYWGWNGLLLPRGQAVVRGPAAGAVGIPPAEQVPSEARGIVEAMATPRGRADEWFQPEDAIGAALLLSGDPMIGRVWGRMLSFSLREAWERMWREDRAGFNRAVQGVAASIRDEDARGRRVVSGSELVPGMRGRTEAPMEMTRTSGGLGEYPTAIRAHVQNFRDTSYRNDMYDSVEFSVGPNVYRLWVAPEDRASRENEEDPRYAVMTVDPPHAGATLDEIFEGGQPSGDTIFESESPHDLFRFLREFGAHGTMERERAIMAATRAVPFQQPRDTSGMAAPYLEAYLDAIDAMDLADDIGGPDDNDYIELMGGIAAFASMRAEGRQLSESIDQSVLSSDIFDHVRMAINRMQDTAVGRDEERSENYRQPLRRIAAEARRRAEVVGRVLGGEREAEVRRELGMPLRPAPISPSQVPRSAPMPPRLDMSEVRGLNEVVRVAEQAVAGHQNLLLIGPPGVGKTMIARRIPTIFPPHGDVAFRSPHHTISAAGLASDDPRSEVELARGGVLFLDELEEFQPSAIEALAAKLRRMPAGSRPLIVGSVGSMPLPRRIAQALDFPLRAEVRALQLADMRYGPQAESSATIRARIAAGPPEPEDLTAARFKQLEIGRAAPPSPMERSIRLARQLQVGTRVHVISAVIRPPELYIPRGAAGEVTTKDDRSGEHNTSNWRIEVTMDDGTKVWWANQNLEHLGDQLEIEPESAERYRMIELNPTKRRMKHNPEWVTKLLSKHFEFLEDKVEAKWLPRLSDVGAKGGKVLAALKEYGCGAYGCVLPTLDPKVVLKVTTDDTEAQFAEQLSENLPSQVTVTYHLVARLPEKHAGRDVWLLWRDSAEDVGKIDEVVAKAGRNKKAAEAAINAQHRAAQLAFVALIKADDPDGAADMAKRMAASKRITAKEAKAVLVDDYNKYLDAWEAAAVEMGDKVPELRELARGMVEDLRSEGVLFGDIHADNIGRVGKQWLIIDPGHVSVMQST